MLNLAIGLLDNLVYFVAVLLSKLVDVLESSIKVLASTGDPSDVRVGDFFDVVDCLVGVRGGLLQLLGSFVVFLLSSVG